MTRINRGINAYLPRTSLQRFRYVPYIWIFGLPLVYISVFLIVIWCSTIIFSRLTNTNEKIVPYLLRSLKNIRTPSSIQIASHLLLVYLQLQMIGVICVNFLNNLRYN
jgi:hypothetical protein